LHDPNGLAAFCDTLRDEWQGPARLIELDAHINDAAFADEALAVFDGWLADGTVVRDLIG
jgi:uncharacterized protein (UPF0261 family)